MRAAAGLIGVVTALLASLSTDVLMGQANTAPQKLKVAVVGSYPHDRMAFTQGLIWRDGLLYESTGLVGQSSLRKVDLTTGTVARQVAVPGPYFAEGLADVGNRLFQLTWQHGRVFVYDKNTFNRVGELGYEG